MADTLEELVDLNKQATDLLSKYDNSFTKLDETAETKKAEIETLAQEKLDDIENGSKTAIGMVNDGGVIKDLEGNGVRVSKVVEYVYTDVFEDLNNSNLIDLPAPLGDGSAFIITSKDNATLEVAFIMNVGNEKTWRCNFFRPMVSYNDSEFSYIDGAGFANYQWNDSVNGTSATVGTTVVIQVPEKNTKVAFKVRHIGHDNGGYLHLNQNNQDDSNSANNTYSMGSRIIIKEI